MRRKIHQLTGSYSLRDSKYYQDFHSIEPFKNGYHSMNLHFNIVPSILPAFIVTLVLCIESIMGITRQRSNGKSDILMEPWSHIRIFNLLRDIEKNLLICCFF